jgi:segregation and condensation protein B
MNEFYFRNVVEAALLAAGKPLTIAELGQLFDESTRPKVEEIRAALDGLAAEYSNRGLEVKETAAGFRIQVRREFAGEISRLWPERPAKYSRALLETLALIAYRQPITRAEIEAVRGVAVNPNIVKTVIERNWVRVVGHRDVPGRPELLGTTREFLDYFGLRSLDELPPLAELKAMGDYNLQLDLPNAGALEAPKGEGEGEVEGVAGLLGNDAVAESAAEAVVAASDGVGAHDAAGSVDGIERDSVAGAADDVVSDAVVDGSAATGDDVSDAAVSDGAAPHDAVSDAAGAHDGLPDADGLSAPSVAHELSSDGTGVHDAVSDATGAARDGIADADGLGAHDAVLHAVGTHYEVASADGHDLSSSVHDAMSHATNEAHDAVSHATDAHDEVAAVAHDAVAKTDIDDDTEADRTLSADDAISSELQDALDDASEDDADDDELSADGHGSRELVAAPRDSDS